MPAIQPARLRQQAAMLSEHFDDPTAYVRSLHYLLDFYADRARRSGQSGAPGPLIQAYNVRPPVLRIILQELTPLALDDPQGGLALCDALWQQVYLEFRLLATMLLGQMPPDPPDTIIQRVQTWMTSDMDDHLVTALLTQGLARLRLEDPQAIVKLARHWLNLPDTFYQQVGLRALLPLIQDPDFENLPVFFRMIQPLCRTVSPSLRPYLLDVLQAMARRSPQETAYFLRQTLESTGATDTPWIIRQLLHDFPPEIEASLRDNLRSQQVEQRSKS